MSYLLDAVSWKPVSWVSLTDCGFSWIHQQSEAEYYCDCLYAAGVVQLIFYTETEGNTERAGEKSVNPRSWLYFVKKHNSSRINCSTCVGWAKNTPATIFMWKTEGAKPSDSQWAAKRDTLSRRTLLTMRHEQGQMCQAGLAGPLHGQTAWDFHFKV